MRLVKNPLALGFGLVFGVVAWFTYFGLGWLPNKVRYFVLLPFVWFLFQLLPSRKQKIKDNLVLIDPRLSGSELDKAAWENVKTLLRSWSSLLSTSKDKPPKISGGQLIVEPYNQGKGIVVVFPHVGPLNELASAIAALNVQAFVPAEAIPPLLFKLMSGLRARHGNIEFAPVQKGKTLEKCAQKLSEGKIVVLAMDIATSNRSKGYLLSIGKAQTIVSIGAVKLALENDALMFLAYPSWDNLGRPFVSIREFQMVRAGDELERKNSVNLLAEYEDFLSEKYRHWWRLPLVTMFERVDY